MLDFTDQAGAPVLVYLHGSRSARAVQDELTDDEIAAGALAALRAGYDGVPEPRAVAVTRGRHGPFTPGACSARRGLIVESDAPARSVGGWGRPPSPATPPVRELLQRRRQP